MVLLLEVILSIAFAIPVAKKIPNHPAQFLVEGVFRGGGAMNADLTAIRHGHHSDFERWVVDFSKMPPFILQAISGGTPTLRFLFRSVENVKLQTHRLNALTQKSRFLKQIVLYPQIEGGDTAMEWVLQENVKFAAHSPVHSSRIVVDLKEIHPE